MALAGGWPISTAMACSNCVRLADQFGNVRNLVERHAYSLLVALNLFPFLGFLVDDNPAFRRMVGTDLVDRKSRLGQPVLGCVLCQVLQLGDCR